jgi:HK97 family phage portal protein
VNLSFLGRIKYFFRNLSLTDPKSWNRGLWNLIGSQSLSGENVTPDTALTYSAYYNAIALISGTVGALPLHLMQRKPNNKKRIADDRGLYRVMHDCWNPYMTAMAGRECLMSHTLGWGNGYAEKVFNGLGELVELWPITPDRVTPELKNNGLVYRIRMEVGQDIYLPREKVLHIPGLGFDGFIGYSIAAMARKSIGLGMALETFGALYFGQGTHPGVIVSHPGNLSAETHANLKSSLTETYSGLGKSHKLMLLEEGLKLEKIGIPPNDSQFLESRQFQIPDIARWFNLPPHKLKDLTKSSFNNIESEQISFVTDSILPWLVRLEQNYNMQLLAPNEQTRQRLYFKHVVEGLLRADAAARGAFYRDLWNIGGITINEIREKEDFDPSDQPFADEHFVPLNMVPLSLVKEKMAQSTAIPQPPTEPTIPKKKPGNGKGKEPVQVNQ